MNKTFFLSMLASFITVLMLALPVSTYATTGAYNYVNEKDTTYTSRSGPYTDVTTTGYPPAPTNRHAYKSTARTFNGPINTMKWKCKTSYSTNYNFHIYVAIPENYDVLDGIYAYEAYNTDPTENFDPPVNVNQENYVNQWVYLGFTRGKGGSNACYVYTNNIQIYGDNPREFWVDHMKYWPNSSTTPPAQTHGWVP